MARTKDLKPRTRRTKVDMSDERMAHREKAKADLEYFIELIIPKQLIGNIHRELIHWWTRPQALNRQLVLFPRDHCKSTYAAFRVVWELTRNPTARILYISSTSNLATKQLKLIKDILTSDRYRMFWPEMVEKEEAKREKWTEREISIDHPLRKEEHIRDPSVFTAGLTSNIVGLHCDIAVLDDVVTQSNAYTEEGREKAKDQYSFLSSIEGVGAKEWVVGTRYHPLDLYSNLIELEIKEFDELGNVTKSKPLFEVFERQVESIGDGSGEFLWPRQRRSDGKWFGFDQQSLAEKRSGYINQLHFRAQYYNDPHDVGSSPIKRELFQYYEPSNLFKRDTRWFYQHNALNVFAAVDFAYSQATKADSTSIVVAGVDGSGNYYVLDIDRFKTDKISEYFNHILRLHQKWGFRKLRAEVSVAQQVIVKDLKESYIKPYGLALSVEEFRPSRWQGSKEERIMAVLEPKYANGQIWHYPSGNCQLLEEELIYFNPPHDDIKDALASCIDFAQAPTFSIVRNKVNPITYNERWGGVN
jgi:hypothetical protein